MLNLSPKLILTWLIKDFFKIVAFMILVSGGTVYFVLQMPNQYSSNATVISNFDSSGGLSGGALGKLGGLAGISLNSSGSKYSPEILQEMLLSADFLGPFIQSNNLAPVVIAAEGIDGNGFLFNEKLFDSKSNSWVREVTYPQARIPSNLEVANRFKEFFVVNYRKRSGLLELSFISYSPEFSKKVLSQLISSFNHFLKEKDLAESEDKLTYLKAELETSRRIEINTVLQQLIEDEYKKLSLAHTRSEYALRILEEPQLAVLKSGPKRGIICIGVVFVSTMSFILLLLIFRIFKEER